MKSKTKISRRRFVGKAGAALAASTIVPRNFLAGSGVTPPSEKINIACIGVGGRGATDVMGVKGENIIALCDVDDRRASATFKKFPQAKKYRDYRKMLDDMDKSIDAVVVATPDHTHAVAVMAAIKRGKHVYCEKPLAHSIHETRTLMKAAREHGVVTQLGNQGHSWDTIREFCECIRDGAIGNVHTVHAFCNGYYSFINWLGRLKEKHEVPPTLDWDLWLGPAQMRNYHPLYLPTSWRGWLPFGSGVIGDYLCHIVDPVFWALDLGAPATIEAEGDGYDPKNHADTIPWGLKITFEFPARGKRGPLTLVWFDGATEAPPPGDLEPGGKLPDKGAIVMGDRGTIIHGSHGARDFRILPEDRAKAYRKPEPTIPRVPGSHPDWKHHNDWLDAIRKNTQAGSNFDFGGPLSELALLGVIATRMPGKKLQWDGPNMRFTNSEEANQWIHTPYRKGWAL